ncbi:Rieske (2Fe-2S) protein [Sneathiella sp.]|uniref:Rieske (2Fe-2S) protein n=1 Tax=Sneathiella sp. TaxID=1964365 RepID=UPI002608C9E2|nr:Rieske (2Fe-2S) protein [Sneathiella sp.]MDF2368641.1 Rieske (2Fe-2S) protein [Sneathiella sp.]
MKKEMREWQKVASVEDITADQPLEVIVEDTIVILLKVGDAVKAYQGLCPHQFARLSLGSISKGSLHCPHHKASFDIHDGTCGPGWQLPALREYHVRVEAGMVSLAHPLAVISGHD